ncbi:MAG: dynamin family protein [Eubacterium sp.]|nr:dynamin family protein [Eubacterium sp.]
MTIKIISNPYTREIKFLNYNDVSQQWEDIKENNTNSKLREDESGRNFLPFRVKEIIDTIIAEYYVNGDKIYIQFEGTQDEFSELEKVCGENGISDKIELSRTQNILENAKTIFEPTKETFAAVQPIIEKIISDDINVSKNLNKVSDALKDIIPICVFGNYSAGKSTFINALIGGEVLPSGGDPVTAKVYKIERSKYPDTAWVRFSYKGEEFEILFEGTDYRLRKGNAENELIKNIFNSIKECGANDMNTFASIAVELINGYEKKDKDDTVISNVIELEIPFSKSGILGTSSNNFVIFDTPGSNSESNAEHTKVLEEALEGFSNGIPVWVSTYETIDSTDNASLCEKILDIKALDKRFTMIILNKADGSDLDEGGFSAKRQQEILEYNSVEKMYASGIYFVSSIMGLGAKNNGVLADKHYRKIYRSQQEMYSDPDDEDYAALYTYNIMPHQIKKKAEKYSAECQNMIYANSGLYCVEQEMENFASKHAAYNKCQMVYMFLKEVIEETDRRIISRTESLKRTREARRRELEDAKSKLIDSLNERAKESEENFKKESVGFVKSFVAANLKFNYGADELNKMQEELHKGNVEEHNFSVQEKDFENSKNSISSNVKKNVKDIFSGGVKEIFSGENNIIEKLSKAKDDLVRDYTTFKESLDEKNLAEKEIDKETSDELMQAVNERYKENITRAQEILSNSIKEHWQQNAQSLRNTLIEIVTGSDALSSSQREELSNIILNYQPIAFNDDSNDVFIKPMFLRGNLFGVQLFKDEKLNIRKLSYRYNDKISKSVNEMAEEMNKSDFSSFRGWKENLSAVIEENITEYNPQLRDMSDMIKEETEKIAELEDNQLKIQQSLNTIEELMSWKTID